MAEIEVERPSRQHLSDRVAQMRAMVEHDDYFCVNRARQYGKTTTLAALKRALAGSYAVAGLDFQALSHADFADEAAFARSFASILLDAEELGQLELPFEAVRALEGLADAGAPTLTGLFRALRRWIRTSKRPVVLVIDEVDSATNNQVFLDFLAQLRLGYLSREDDPSYPAFQSVVLAGVTGVRCSDGSGRPFGRGPCECSRRAEEGAVLGVRQLTTSGGCAARDRPNGRPDPSLHLVHLKAKIRPEEQAKVNSPWNIAADFDVDMSFSGADVAGMLADYEADHAMGMDVAAVATELAAWTGGYPFLASHLCQLVDERGLGWDHAGVDAAVKVVLTESNTLFESLSGKLEAYPDPKEILRSVLMEGKRLPYSADHEGIAQLVMYGFVRRDASNSVQVANRIFETRLYNLFILEDKIAGSRIYDVGDFSRSEYVRGGRLDMRAVLEGFRRAYVQVFGPPEEGERFGEFDGRRQFLLFLKPIINGTGNYYIEAQTRDQTRTDMVVDYAGEQFVVELKVWWGPRYNEEGEEQLRGYLDHFGLEVGYMLSFNFNKRKEPGLRRVPIGDKILWEETV